jgi:argininosuccinate synthase
MRFNANERLTNRSIIVFKPVKWQNLHIDSLASKVTLHYITQQETQAWMLQTNDEYVMNENELSINHELELYY